VPWWHPRNVAAAIGWTPTVIRFPTPAAENTLAYHFEIEAPPVLQISSATLIAGRPNVKKEKPSWDHVTGGFPVVGLHAIEVPNGSMSRCQVELRLNRRGWLSSSLVTSVLSSALLWATWAAAVKSSQASLVAATLLAITAAVMIFIVQPSEHQMASRLVTSIRAAATASVFLLISVGAYVTFVPEPSRSVVMGSAVVSTACTLLVLLAWIRARPDPDRRISPWEQGLTLGPDPERPQFDNLHEAREHFDFDRPAIIVESSEGDHRDKFRWTKDHVDHLSDRLKKVLRRLRSEDGN
jgi:hypothetical protein